MKVFYSEHAFAYPKHGFMICGGPEAFTSTTMFKECGGKTISRRAGMLHPVNPLGVSYPTCYMYIYIYVFFLLSVDRLLPCFILLIMQMFYAGIFLMNVLFTQCVYCMCRQM